jgi:hypothetical protein
MYGSQFWPGSHKRFYPTFEFESNGRPTRDNIGHPLYQPVYDEVVAEVEPIEVCGEAGDVVWCKPSCLSGASRSHSQSQYDISVNPKGLEINLTRLLGCCRYLQGMGVSFIAQASTTLTSQDSSSRATFSRTDQRLLRPPCRFLVSEN